MGPTPKEKEKKMMQNKMKEIKTAVRESVGAE